MARPGLERNPDIIHLSSDSGDDRPVDKGVAWFDVQPTLAYPDDSGLDNLFEGLPEISEADDRDLINLNAIPDIHVPPSEHHSVEPENSAPGDDAGGVEYNSKLFTKEECLQLVLDVLPDISVEYVLKTIHDNTVDATRTLRKCEQLVDQIIDSGEYLKQADEKNYRKRKRDVEESLSDYEYDESNIDIHGYEADA